MKNIFFHSKFSLLIYLTKPCFFFFFINSMVFRIKFKAIKINNYKNSNGLNLWGKMFFFFFAKTSFSLFIYLFENKIFKHTRYFSSYIYSKQLKLRITYFLSKLHFSEQLSNFLIEIYQKLRKNLAFETTCLITNFN
jgi:hypothetical protein